MTCSPTGHDIRTDLANASPVSVRPLASVTTIEAIVGIAMLDPDGNGSVDPVTVTLPDPTKLYVTVSMFPGATLIVRLVVNADTANDRPVLTVSVRVAGSDDPAVSATAVVSSTRAEYEPDTSQMPGAYVIQRLPVSVDPITVASNDPAVNVISKPVTFVT